MRVEMDTAFLIRGPVSRMSECIGFCCVGVESSMMVVEVAEQVVLYFYPSLLFSLNIPLLDLGRVHVQSLKNHRCDSLERYVPMLKRSVACGKDFAMVAVN